ncbi:MAG: dTDP-4-dehydrorhamnose reductase [Planctomycetota bacterium]|nr:dTDP-4-dehydrorhamnose reductase [Planctomycetota bacterium]MDA0931851.1 dTDP-4-dehydrorhamnose reductase [Planctomycetota bacterium]
MTIVLVTGAGGQLGRAVVDAAALRGFAVVGLDRAAMPVENADLVREQVARHRPDCVVHCAAWTDVDGCEADPTRADRVNGHATAYVAEACRAVDARLLAVSTDYVFAGLAPKGADGHSRAFVTDDCVDPESSYGRSKLLGEQAVLRAPLDLGFCVVRTSWVFGPGGRNFPGAILARARSGQPLRVVDDQIGCPTYAVDLAEALLDLAVSDRASGVYHAANEGVVSWHGFAVELLRQAGLDVEVGTMTTAELGRPAPRPAWSALDCSKLTALRGRPLPPWQDAVARYLSKESK